MSERRRHSGQLGGTLTKTLRCRLFGGLSRNLLLDQSIAGFDPTATSIPPRWKALPVYLPPAV
jgi:hypothetical protein